MAEALIICWMCWMVAATLEAMLEGMMTGEVPTPEDPCNELSAPVTLCTAEFRPDPPLLPKTVVAGFMEFAKGTPLLGGSILAWP